ncbi:hypothetical protein K435DRAFT_911496 [Dendrothele bispora CBS 962.96]|uniref:NB-ARC domain-containing protein n=1 Tax=Dendrothele bispora (strain CBS 962.96) TaxID=1314807 RepID=A0A4S8MWS3_DENBC|nr:hypothetical protein K435DRAFT_911496 [Dendrothele bispora CBS 962.96]
MPFPRFRPTKNFPQEEHARHDEVATRNRVHFTYNSHQKYRSNIQLCLKEQPALVVEVGCEIHLITVSNLIKANSQQARTSLERAEQLSKRIRDLSLVMVQGLSGKPLEEISEVLKRDIEEFRDSLVHIDKMLQRVFMQPRLLTFLSKNETEETMNEHVTLYCNELNQVLNVPQLSHQIHSSTVLRKIENDIEKHYEKLNAIWKNTEDIKTMLLQFVPEFRQDSNSMPRKPWFPPRSSVFYGRDELVERLATRLTSVSAQGDHRVLMALLGAGGMGKTSAALAVMEHPFVVKQFGDFNRFWIPCVKAESVALLLDTLYDSLCINRKTGNTLNDILAELEPPSGQLELQPFRALLLDNFDTPWNLGAQEQSEVEVILRSLMRIPNVSILITMRANQPPTEEWERVRIPSLDPQASAKIYKDLCPNVRETEEQALFQLVHAIGYLPLAITLIAKYAQTNGATPTELLEDWDREGTAILTLTDDGAHNMIDRSIKLSIDSPPMRRSSDSLKFLMFLSMFPAGITTSVLPDWNPNAINLRKALSVLSSAALIEQRDEVVLVIPVIRSYVLHPIHTPPQFLKDARQHVLRVCCTFLSQHNSRPGDDCFPEDRLLISGQEVNLQSILLDATSQLETDVGPETFEALLILSRHQQWTRPRFEFVQHTLAVAERTGQESYVAQSLACYGEMCLALDQYNKAIEKLSLAHDKFILLGDRSAAAHCTLQVFDCMTHKDPSFKRATPFLSRAQSEYGPEDDFGQAQCVFYLGVIYWQQNGNEDLFKAHNCLNQARMKFMELGKRFESAHCLQQLSKTYQTSIHQPRPNPNPMSNADPLSKALQLANNALELYDQFKCEEYVGRCLLTLSEILLSQKSYDDALGRAHQALKTYKSLGNPLGVAQALRSCCDILFGMGDYDAAGDAGTKALTSLNLIDDGFSREMETKECDYLLERIRNALIFEDAESKTAVEVEHGSI